MCRPAPEPPSTPGDSLCGACPVRLESAAVACGPSPRLCACVGRGHLAGRTISFTYAQITVRYQTSNAQGSGHARDVHARTAHTHRSPYRVSAHRHTWTTRHCAAPPPGTHRAIIARPLAPPLAPARSRTSSRPRCCRRRSRQRTGRDRPSDEGRTDGQMGPPGELGGKATLLLGQLSVELQVYRR